MLYIVELLQAQSRRQSHLGHLDVSIIIVAFILVIVQFLQGAKEMILDGTNQSKVEIKNLTESLEAQVAQC